MSEEFCEEYGITLILKGHHTVVTSPDLRQQINIIRQDAAYGARQGGSGDVLAGMVAALAARGTDGTHAGSRSRSVCMVKPETERAIRITGEESLTATDILEAIRL